MIYIISHHDYECECNEKCVSQKELLLDLIEQYKKEQKELGICVKVFKVDGDLIYAQVYKYDDDSEIILDNCLNMKDKYWNC